jgi:hypothetical protein
VIDFTSRYTSKSLNNGSIPFPVCQTGPSCSKYWIRLSTVQLLIQWTASQWLKLVDQKQRQWLDNSHDFFALPLLQQSRPKIKKGLLSSATFQVIFHTVQFICCDLQMIYDQSLRETFFFFFFPRSWNNNPNYILYK